MIKRILSKFCSAPHPTPPPPSPVSDVDQILLKTCYRQMYSKPEGAKPLLRDSGFKIFSQTDEDGLLLHIFSVLGEGSKLCVEICAGDGKECNSANLLINHGWHGLLVDGNADMVRTGRDYYRNHPHTRIYPPIFQQAWITRTNVNETVKEAGFTGQVDLLSLDLDGMDYWIWDALTIIEPRVVVLEYQDILGPERSVTVPYRDDFNAYEHPTTDGMPNYGGASLRAFQGLAARRGYRLVGCNRYGYNAFFVRNPEGLPHLPEVSIESCFQHPKVRHGMATRYPSVQHLPWVEV